MALDGIKYAAHLSASLKSVKTADDILCGGDLTVTGTLNVEGGITVDNSTVKGDLTVDPADDGSGEPGDVIVSSGDIYLGVNPASVGAERIIERSIICGGKDAGLDGGALAKIGMVGTVGDTIPGLIKFYAQSSNTVPPSELLETMRISGGKVGIQATEPVCEFQAVGATSLGNSWPGVIQPGRTGGSRGAALAVRSLEAGVSGAGGFVFEAGSTSDGLTTDYSTISCNMYVSGGAQYAQPLKLGWRQTFDQRTGGASPDRWQVESLKSPTCPNIGRMWLDCDGKLGDFTINNSVIMANSSAGSAPTSGDRAVLRPKTDFAINLGTGSFRYGDVWADNFSPVSDMKVKKDIAPLTRGLTFVKALAPKEYRMKHGTSGRKHWGLLAQDVETILADFGDVDGQNSALVAKELKKIPDPDWVRPMRTVRNPDWTEESGEEVAMEIEVEDEDAEAPLIDSDESSYALRYLELIPVLINAIKEMDTKINLLSA